MPVALSPQLWHLWGLRPGWVPEQILRHIRICLSFPNVSCGLVELRPRCVSLEHAGSALSLASLPTHRDSEHS